METGSMLGITVVIPYYNESRTILRTLEYLLRQTHTPDRVLLIDSGSTDGAPDVISRWIEDHKSSSHIRFENVRALTGVPSSSKNVGVRMATTPLVAFMDCGLLFPNNWLERQYAVLQQYGAEVVSCVVVLKGEGCLDVAAVAQTYGYLRKRPCVPGSLMYKSVFEKTGLFREGLRAGYDVEWVNILNEKGVHRHVNDAVVLESIGASYALSFRQLFNKVKLYSSASFGIRGYCLPYLYMGFSVSWVLLLLVAPGVACASFLLYLVFRGYGAPIMKSRNLKCFNNFRMVYYLPLVGFLIDVAKVVGYCKEALSKLSW